MPGLRRMNLVQRDGTSFFSRQVVSLVVVSLILLLSNVVWAGEKIGKFSPERDLYLPQFDCKTDVDDVHSAAAVATMLRSPRMSGVNYHAVTGTYGIQEGLYVPPNELFELAFAGHWSDAHKDREQALQTVVQMVRETLLSGGSVWVAEAGQSDFTADWLKRIEALRLDSPKGARVHVVQHSDWNESVTSPDKLEYVRQHAEYHKIPDGNSPDNGSPDFHEESDLLWRRVLDSERDGETWRLAKDIADEFNGAEGRYENSAIAGGGMDFSDVAESSWIFGFDGIKDAEAFFDEFLSAD